jgi:acyl carrier protein
MTAGISSPEECPLDPNAKEGAVRSFILSRLMQASNQQLQQEDLQRSALNDTGIDSLELMELLLKIEERFNVQIEDNSIGASTSVEDLIRYVEGILLA